MFKRSLFFIVTFVAFIFLAILLPRDVYDGLYNYNFICFTAIIAYSLFRLSKERYSYGLNMFFWLFVLFFLGIIPFFQYSSGNFPWPNKPDSGVVLKANFIIILFLGIYQSTCIFLKNSRTKEIGRKRLNFFKINYRIGIFIFLSCAISIFILRPGLSLFFRYEGNLTVDSNDSDSVADLLLNKFVRSAMIYFLFYSIYQYKSGRVISKYKLWFFSIIGVVTNFPLALPRYFVASFYLGMLLTIKRTIKNPILIPSLMIGALLILFPILTLFRFSYGTFEYLTNNVSEIIGGIWRSGDFDAFSMLCRTIEYVNREGYSLGRQLLGTLLFFIPRSIWPTKPVGSGYHIAEWYGWNFKNVSCPFPAEGYINFGIIGVILFAIVLATITIKYDRYYWETILSQKMTFWSLIYPGFLGLYFFMLRGDLLSSYAYIIGFIVPAYFMHLLLNKGFRRR